MSVVGELKMFNSQAGHDKVYAYRIITTNETPVRYGIAAFYGSRSTYNHSGVNGLRPAPVSARDVFTSYETAKQHVLDLALDRRNKKGYTIHTDGVTPCDSWRVRDAFIDTIRDTIRSSAPQNRREVRNENGDVVAIAYFNTENPAIRPSDAVGGGAMSYPVSLNHRAHVESPFEDGEMTMTRHSKIKKMVEGPATSPIPKKKSRLIDL